MDFVSFFLFFCNSSWLTCCLCLAFLGADARPPCRPPRSPTKPRAFGPTPDDDDDGGWETRYVPGRGKGSPSRTSSPRASLDAGPGLRLRTQLTKSTKFRLLSGTRFTKQIRNPVTWRRGNSAVTCVVVHMHIIKTKKIRVSTIRSDYGRLC